MAEEHLKILIVEDEEAHAEAVRRALKSSDAFSDIRIADTLREYRHLVEAAPPDIALMDLNLPDGKAVEVLTSPPEAGPFPVLIMTSYGNEHIAVETMKAGALDYLVKSPEAFSSMPRTVERAMREWKLLQDRKRAEEEVREVSRQLWQATKLATVGELAASIAHELNNPLATVSLRVEALMGQTPKGDSRRRALEVIAQEVARMGNLVANMLQFSRSSAPQVSTLDLRQEIEKTLELIYYHLRKRGINVVRDFSLEVPQIHADRQQLRQLFLNLFTNAGDSMPKGGDLTIRVSGSDKGLAIEITDTGMGIAPEDLPKIMEPFFTTKPEDKGTGLGLSICRRIVDEHKGTLEIKSILGKGTTVFIGLPLINGMEHSILKET